MKLFALFVLSLVTVACGRTPPLTIEKCSSKTCAAGERCQLNLATHSNECVADTSAAPAEPGQSGTPQNEAQPSAPSTQQTPPAAPAPAVLPPATSKEAQRFVGWGAEKLFAVLPENATLIGTIATSGNGLVFCVSYQVGPIASELGCSTRATKRDLFPQPTKQILFPVIDDQLPPDLALSYDGGELFGQRHDVMKSVFASKWTANGFGPPLALPATTRIMWDRACILMGMSKEGQMIANCEPSGFVRRRAAFLQRAGDEFDPPSYLDEFTFDGQPLGPNDVIIQVSFSPDFDWALFRRIQMNYEPKHNSTAVSSRVGNGWGTPKFFQLPQFWEVIHVGPDLSVYLQNYDEDRKIYVAEPIYE